MITEIIASIIKGNYKHRLQMNYPMEKILKNNKKVEKQELKEIVKDYIMKRK